MNYRLSLKRMMPTSSSLLATHPSVLLHPHGFGCQLFFRRVPTYLVQSHAKLINANREKVFRVPVAQIIVKCHVFAGGFHSMLCIYISTSSSLNTGRTGFRCWAGLCESIRLRAQKGYTKWHSCDDKWLNFSLVSYIYTVVLWYTL